MSSFSLSGELGRAEYRRLRELLVRLSRGVAHFEQVVREDSFSSRAELDVELDMSVEDLRHVVTQLGLLTRLCAASAQARGAANRPYRRGEPGPRRGFPGVAGVEPSTVGVAAAAEMIGVVDAESVRVWLRDGWMRGVKSPNGRWQIPVEEVSRVKELVLSTGLFTRGEVAQALAGSAPAGGRGGSVESMVSSVVEVA